MTINEMKQFITDNRNRIPDSDAFFILFQQALAAYEAIDADINNGSPTAATDLMIFTIGNKALPVGCFFADTIAAINDMLYEIMSNAIDQIYLADPDMIV